MQFSYRITHNVKWVILWEICAAVVFRAGTCHSEIKFVWIYPCDIPTQLFPLYTLHQWHGRLALTQSGLYHSIARLQYKNCAYIPAIGSVLVLFLKLLLILIRPLPGTNTNIDQVWCICFVACNGIRLQNLKSNMIGFPMIRTPELDTGYVPLYVYKYTGTY